MSHNYIATLWREHGLKSWRVGTFKLSRDPAFAEKVGDIVGLYLEPRAPRGLMIRVGVRNLHRRACRSRNGEAELGLSRS